MDNGSLTTDHRPLPALSAADPTTDHALSVVKGTTDHNVETTTAADDGSQSMDDGVILPDRSIHNGSLMSTVDGRWSMVDGQTSDLHPPSPSALHGADLLDELLALGGPAAQTAEPESLPVLANVTVQPPRPLTRSEAEWTYIRALLLEPELRRIAQLEAENATLRARLTTDALHRELTPMIGPAISQRVRESRDEMAEALYPIIGKAVMRAVNEGIRELAQRIDHTLRVSLRQQLTARLRFWVRGVDPQAAALRELLPFTVRELLVIHRASGLLVHHHSVTGTLADADLIGGMLSAIRSYVHDAFTAEGALEAISYGELRILIEDGSSVLLAVVIEGIEPAGYRDAMRTQLSLLHASHGAALATFQGDSLPEAVWPPYLMSLVEERHEPT